MSAHPSWREILIGGALAAHHGADLLLGTAGIRALSLHTDVLDNLDGCFPEFRPYLGQCALGDCSHLHEPGCAIRAALEAGQITRARYSSYGRFLRGEGDPVETAARDVPYLWWSGFADRNARLP
jgi:ribosome biogenesis GTPase